MNEIEELKEISQQLQRINKQINDVILKYPKLVEIATILKEIQPKKEKSN